MPHHKRLHDIRGALALSLCLILAACVSTSGGAKPSVAAAPPAQAQAAAPPANTPAPAAKPKAPMTHRQASVDCWMATEGSKITRNLDKRAAQVEKCVEAKMKGQPAR